MGDPLAANGRIPPLADRETEAEEVLGRRVVAEGGAEVRGVCDVDLLLEHDHPLELDHADLNREERERPLNHRVAEKPIPEGVHVARERKDRWRVGPAGFLDLEFADVIVRLPPCVRERALVGGRTVDRVRGDEAEVLAERRAPDQENVGVAETD